MKNFSKRQVIVGVVLIVLFISIPITVSILSQQQKTETATQTHAAASTSLSFMPTSSVTSPIQTSVGSTINLDLYVNPGSNLVTFVRYQVMYDPTKVQIVTSDPVDLNNQIFANIEGPVLNSGSIAQSISIGSNPTNVITQSTKIGTLHFKAIGGTNGGTTTISFGNLSQALSSSSNDQASENVLSTTIPAVISINGTSSPSPSVSLSESPSVSPVTGTALSFTVLLDGVGAAGDNPNPTGNSLSNKNPLHPQRTLNVQVFDTNNNLAASGSGNINYNSTSGTFLGAVGLPATVQSGDYYVKVQTDRYLWKLVPGIIQITSDQTTKVPSVQLVNGDTNNDNLLNIIDYNALIDCGYGEINPLPMNDQNSTYNSSACQVHQPTQDVDLNDDGIIDSTDYNLFLRELSVQNGD